MRTFILYFFLTCVLITFYEKKCGNCNLTWRFQEQQHGIHRMSWYFCPQIAYRVIPSHNSASVLKEWAALPANSRLMIIHNLKHNHINACSYFHLDLRNENKRKNKTRLESKGNWRGVKGKHQQNYTVLDHTMANLFPWNSWSSPFCKLEHKSSIDGEVIIQWNRRIKMKRKGIFCWVWRSMQAKNTWSDLTTLFLIWNLIPGLEESLASRRSQ
jgi:hypothetical protein